MTTMMYSAAIPTMTPTLMPNERNAHHPSYRPASRRMPGRGHAIPLLAIFDLPPIPPRYPIPAFNPQPMPGLPPIPPLPQGQNPLLPGVDPRIQIRDIRRIVRNDRSLDGVRYVLRAATHLH